MKKTKIKFLIATFAAIGFIFFFVSESQAAGCCKCKGSSGGIETFSCMDDVVNENTCKSSIVFPITDCDFFDNTLCADIQECPQATPAECWSDNDCPKGRKCVGVIYDPFAGYPTQKGKCEVLPPVITPPTPPPEYKYEPVYPSLQIPIPGIPSLTEFAKVEIKGEPGERYVYIPWIGQYISALYGWALGIVGVLATVMIIWGGIIYLTAGGVPERISTAKSYITSALIGLVLTFGSYLLLYTINPDLVKFAAMKIKLIERVPYTFDTIVGGEESNAVNIPTSLKSIQSQYIISQITDGTSLELNAEAADKLLRVVEKIYKEQNKKIVVTSATRTYDKQCELFKTNCNMADCSKPAPKGQCDPPTCYPGPDRTKTRCPHTSGRAVDIWCEGESTKKCTKDNKLGELLEEECPCHAALEKAMKAEGFCRLSSEIWHFEYPKMSSNCY